MNNKMKSAMIIVSAVVVIGGISVGAYIIGNKPNAMTSSIQNRQYSEGNTRQGNMPSGPEGMRGGPGIDFSQFVEDGTVDQATADKMKTYLEEQIKNMQPNRQNGTPGQGLDLFSGMVSDGIITQEQADKIQESMPKMGQGMPPQ